HSIPGRAVPARDAFCVDAAASEEVAAGVERGPGPIVERSQRIDIIEARTHGAPDAAAVARDAAREASARVESWPGACAVVEDVERLDARVDAARAAVQGRPMYTVPPRDALDGDRAIRDVEPTAGVERRSGPVVPHDHLLDDVVEAEAKARPCVPVPLRDT